MINNLANDISLELKKKSKSKNKGNKELENY